MEPDAKWVWWGTLLGVVVVVALGVAAWRYGYLGPKTAPAPVAAAPSEPAVASAAPASAPEPELHYPLDIASAPDAQPPGIDRLLGDTFGAAGLALFQTDQFARRFVATVDNLGRSHASPTLWPMLPAKGRFSVDGAGTIAAGNAARYAPYVALLEKVDAATLAALYRRLYPQLQAAYEELGFPGKYFNDRLVRVLDQLLAAPEAEAPAVRLPNAGAGAEPVRPWVVYEYDDARLQALGAGQKIMVRMGPANERRVKAKLAEFRKLVTANAVTR